MKKLLFLTFPFLLLSTTDCTAQRRLADSLISLLKKEQPDTIRVIRLNDLSATLWGIGKFDTAITCANEAAALAEKKGYAAGVCSAYMNAATASYFLGNYPNTLDYIDSLNVLAQSTGNKRMLSSSYNIMGAVYNDQGDYAKSLNYYRQSLALNQETGSKNGIANNFGNMGGVYRAQKDYKTALECYTRSLSLHREVKNYNGVANNLGNIAISYEAMGDTAARHGNHMAEDTLYTKALAFYSEALQVAERYGLRINIETNLSGIGNIYRDQGKLKEAALKLDSALTVGKSIGEKVDLQDIYYYRSKLDSARGDYLAGWRDYDTAMMYHDSLANDASTKAQMNFDYRQKISAEKAEQERKDVMIALEKKKQLLIRNMLIAGAFLLAAVVLLLFARYRTKANMTRLLSEQNRTIQEHNAELERLSIVASETDNLVLILGADGKVEWANESFARINGITIDELKKQKGETIFEVSNNPEIRHLVDTAVSEKRSVVYESLNLNKEGKQVWESSTLTPIFGDNGQLRKMVIVDTDITQRKTDEEIIRQKNKDITDSIHYARLIQEAILPDEATKQQLFPDSFILLLPRDIVSGDFYWCTEKNGKKLVAAVDCTGHGVPGAFMSMIGNALLNETVNEKGITEPAVILGHLREKIIASMKQSGASGENKDGMDIALLSFDEKNAVVKFAGANNPLLHYRKADGKIYPISGDKQPIGYYRTGTTPFTSHEVQLEKGDALYIFSDGYADQFGGEKGKKFKFKELFRLLENNVDLPMEQQRSVLADTFHKWKGNLEQVDDVLVIGIRV